MEYRIREHGRGSNIGEEELKAVEDVLSNADTLAYGPRRDKFEREFAEYCGAEHAVSATSATTALSMACQILGLKDGDEVVGTPQTFKATYTAVASRNVLIRFADIDPATLNIDPATIEARITKKTKAIYVMHYGGNPVDMDPVMDIARKHNLIVVEDAAHAPGASYKGRKIGSIADITCFSFHSLKNMSTLGEGGMLTMRNPEYAEAAKALRTMGVLGERKDRESFSIGTYKKPVPVFNDHSDSSFTHDFTRIDEWGNNFRMSEVQAAVGSVQLRKLDWMNRQRAGVAERFTAGLAKAEGIRVPVSTPGSLNVWHLYPCFIEPSVIKATRDEFIDYLQQKKSIQIILRYFPVHLSDYMRFLGHQVGESSICERVWFQEQLNLPINPRMSDEDIDYVVESVCDAARHFRR